MNISDTLLPYILYQRTEYAGKNIFFLFLTKIGRVRFLYHATIFLKSVFFSEKIKKEFEADMNREFLNIKSVLPKSAKAILDIGCGVAGIDIFLSRHYGNVIDIFLLDKTIVEKSIHYNFEKTGSFYNSLGAAGEFLVENNVPRSRIHYAEVTPNNNIPFNASYDIILSLISWGFHYPISTYLDQAYDRLNEGGVLILDIRKSTNGEEEIRKKFGTFDVLLEHDKFFRIIARKRAT